jgi:hypothetical protein
MLSTLIALLKQIKQLWRLLHESSIHHDGTLKCVVLGPPGTLTLTKVTQAVIPKGPSMA